MSLKLWAHMSIAWGIQKSFERSAWIGWNALQVFTKSPRGWFFVSDSLSSVQIELSKNWWTNFNQDFGIIHSVYLVNLAKNPEDAAKDKLSVIDDFQIAHKLWFQAVNVHLGKYWELTKQAAIHNMIVNVWEILEKTKDMDVYFVFENTAGQGSEIGWNFEELWSFYNDLLEKLDSELVKSKIRFCFDTAHGWGAWYDIWNWESVVADYDKYIGIDKLYCFHLNDAKVPMWSKLDRHAPLWTGFIWLPALAKVIRWASENNKPLILETPEEEKWPEEIKMIRSIADWSFTDNDIKEFHKKNYQTQSLKKFENLKDESLF